MKCAVCGTEYSGNYCPLCNFQTVHFPGNYEEGMKKMEPVILDYRKKFFSTVELGVMAYYWKDENGVVTLDRKAKIPFGTLDNLNQGKKQLEQTFARIPDEKTIEVTAYRKIGNEEHIWSLEMDNVLEQRLQHIGVELDENNSFRIYLTNEKSTSFSETVPIF